MIPATALGDVRLSSHHFLKDTSYVPRFAFNLISVSALTADSRLMIQFYHDQFIIQEISSKRMIGKGDRVGDLYLFYPISHTSHITAAVNKVSASTWHNRLGHPSSKSLEVLKTLLPCDELHSLHLSPCYVCPKAKQCRLPFIGHNNLSNSPFDLIHCEIWGPYCVPAHTGDRFFVTLVDDCTRFNLGFFAQI